MGGCPACAGRGWRIVEEPDGSRAERCACWLEAERDRRLDRAGVPPGLRHCDLQTFETTVTVGNHPSVRHAKRVAQDFVETYPLSGATGILFHGPSGTGKTHLAVAIVSELALRKGTRALFLDFRGLLKLIQESWNPVSETSEKEILRRVLDIDLLALDDLGAEKPSPWVRETVAYVINERYARGKPIVITTNLRCTEHDEGRAAARREIEERVGRRGGRQEDQLEDRVGVPTLSRLYEMCKFVELSGAPDYRRTVKVFGTDRFARYGEPTGES